MDKCLLKPDQTVGRDHLIFANGPQGSFTYTRLKGGQVESVTSGYTTDGATATYDYNGLNLIRSISSGTQSYSLNYDAVGNLSYQSLPNGMGVTYVYDDLNRLTSLMVYNSSTTLASYSYNLGPTGNRIGMTEYGGRAVTWIPDDLYRLTSEGITNSTVSGSVSYVMDNVGNRLIRSSDIAAIPTQTFSGAYDLNDRCTATGFTWDANGNMLTDLQGRTFTYDPLNRLTSVTGTGVAVSYVYNADNLRVKKINNISTVTTEYHWDMANVTGYPQVLEELEGGAVVCRYAYGPTGVLSQSRKVNGSWVTSYFGKDAQSVRFLMDDSGTITDSWTWDAYGNLLGRTGSTTCNLGFDGEYLDPDTGLIYLRARWYDPTVGRFISSDTYEGDQEDPLTLHKYAFAANNPINLNDPTGNDFGLMDACASVAMAGVLSSFPNVMFGAEKNIALPYTGQQLLNMTVVQNALKKAWLDSKPFYHGNAFTDYTEKHEEGGWIYENPKTRTVTVIRKNRTAADKNLPPNMFDLGGPVTLLDNYVIANFHTHPFSEKGNWVIGPNEVDEANENARGVPGIIAQAEADYSTGREKIFQKNYTYGPLRRDSFSGSLGYPHDL